VVHFDPFGQKRQKNYFFPSIKIHTPIENPDWVDKKCVALDFFEMISRSLNNKKPQYHNSIKSTL
jgi:hypothetical protein